MTGRRDVVVILARGASSRMGQPKGLLSCPATGGVSFLATIAGRYADLGLAGVVVTLPELVPSYTATLESQPQFSVIGCPPGGETARTLWQGWQHAGGGATHLWAHPVDMPSVTGHTLVQMLASSVAQPHQLVRPACDGTPGHPVIVPSAVMVGLDEPSVWQEDPMREVIAAACRMGHIDEPVILSVSDRGVVMDFDTPADLDRT